MAKNPGPGTYDHFPPELPICQRLPGGSRRGRFGMMESPKTSGGGTGFMSTVGLYI